MRRKAAIVVVAGLLAGGGALIYMRPHERPSAPLANRAGEQGRTDVPVAVSATAVVRRDVPLDLEGLGSVVAYKTVTVRPQVDGRLDAVLFREGQEVKRGDVLAQIDPRPFLIQLHQAEGNLKRDQALLRGTELNVERYAKLTGKKFIAQQQLDDTRSLLGQYQGAVEVDRAQVESARLNLDYARVRSPLDGITGVRNVDPGNLVHANDATGIVVLTQLDPIAVLFTLPQDDLPRIAKHLRGTAALPVDAFDRDGTTKLASGQLLLIDNQINQTTATIRLKAVFPNGDRKLWPNQFVKTRLHLATEAQALVVPSHAVQLGPRGTYVYVVKSDHTVEARPIQVAQTSLDVAIVQHGVVEGEWVVVEGQDQLRPGLRVRVAGETAQRPREDAPRSAP